MDSEEKAPLFGVQNKAAPKSRKPSQCPFDQCVISVDDDIETIQSDSTTSNYDTELAGKVPPLPENKDRHLFVSYSSEDFDDVMAIVNQLEQRFHVSCIISARDFQYGKNIIANIKESIDRSMKNVFMLTPNFIQSGFCKFEREIAFRMSIETGINNVIPVMLHECDVPTSISMVTYIDAMLPGIDVPAKIIEALIQSELADGTPYLEDHILSKKYDNGYCVSFRSSLSETYQSLYPVYTFKLKSEDISSLRRAKIKLPEEQLELMFQRLNTTKLVTRYNETRSRCQLCCSFSGFYLLFSFFCFAAVIVVQHYTGRTDLSIFETYPKIAIPFVFVVCPIVAWITSACCNSRARELSLQMHVWEAASEKCLQFNCIPVVLRSRKTPPTLYIMRYNFHDCQTYLAGLIRSIGRPNKDKTPETYLAGLIRSRGSSCEDETPEEKAEAMIKRSISHLIHHLTPSLEELPDAPYNRHHVRKSKMCLCQMIEAGLPLVNGPDPRGSLI